MEHLRVQSRVAEKQRVCRRQPRRLRHDADALFIGVVVVLPDDLALPVDFKRSAVPRLRDQQIAVGQPLVFAHDVRKKGCSGVPS